MGHTYRVCTSPGKRSGGSGPRPVATRCPIRPKFAVRITSSNPRPYSGIAMLTAVDEVLSGGITNAGAVFRRGEIVDRPAQPHAPAIHRFLAALPEHGFT